MKTPDLKVGDRAPEFQLQDAEGKATTLASLLARGPVLLAFYPGDFTPVCTRQLCSYQSRIEEFSGLGIQVVGISADPVESHQRFRQEKGLGFALLSDPAREVARAYGVGVLKFLNGHGRAVFVVGRDGRIAYRQVEAIPVTYSKPETLIRELSRLRAEGVLDKAGPV